jgi:UDP:flavonoid glycosyltransferase YjiC (YdhE family)
MVPAIRAEVVPGKTVLVAAAIAVGARIVAEADRLPLVTVQLQPSVFMSEQDRPLMDARLAFLQHAPRWIWRAGFFAIQKAIDSKLARQINAVRAELGLREGVKGIMRDWWVSPDRILALFPEWLAPRHGDFPPQTAFSRFPLYDGDAPLAAEAEEYLAEGPPPLLFTPGSANMWGRDFFAAAAGACERLAMRGLFVTPFPEHIRLPKTIRHFDRLPFSKVFPRCAAVIHHGGIGTCAQGFAAGVPQLVMPMAHDQPDNAQRLERLGVGASLVPKHFRAEAVASRLEGLLTSPEVKQACADMKARMLRQMPPEKVADLLAILG